MMRNSTVLRRALYATLAGSCIAIVVMVVLLRRVGPGAPTGQSLSHTTAPARGPRGPAGPALASVGRAPVHRDASVKNSGNWMRTMAGSRDMYTFIFDALPAAVHGNGRAAWAISEALIRCSAVDLMFHGSTDPNTMLAAEERAHMSPNNPQWVRDLLEATAKMCQRLATTDPFAGLPQRAGGYPISYWRDLALADGDGLATVQAAATTLGVGIKWGNTLTPAETATLQTVQTQLQGAVRSGDPDVLFNAGMLLLDGRYAVNPVEGAALALAACDMGYDCSASNPLLPWHNCQYSGACPANADFSYFLQTTGMASEYGQAYQEAQQIAQGLRQGDPSSAVAAVRLKIPKHS